LHLGLDADFDKVKVLIKFGFSTLAVPIKTGCPFQNSF
jgi:hypothetical protein